MDFQRYILIGGIVAVSYMLLIEWRDFESQTPQEPVTVTQTVPEFIDSGESIPIAITDTVPDHDVNTDKDDIPVIVSPGTQASEPVERIDHNVIDISSNVLQLQISLRGGDIIELKLPRHFKKVDTPDDPFTLLQNGKRTYIAQSGLVGPNGTDTAKGKPLFSSKASTYQMNADQDELVVDLEFTQESGVKITKRFTLRRDDYLIDVEYLVDNFSSSPWQGVLYGQIKRDSGPDPASEDGSKMGVQPFLGMATTTNEERFLKMDFEDLAQDPFKSTTQGGWIAILQHYFLSAWIPDQTQLNAYSTIVTRQGFNIVRFTNPAVIVESGKRKTMLAQFYAGPKDQYRLEEISEGLDLTVDYGWLWMIAQPLYWVLTTFHNLVDNWGVAIILLTVLVKGIFFWPSAMAYRSMAKMRKVQPKMLEIKERHGDDRQAQSQAMMELYKKEGVNPLGGCLPIFIQMPVFIALYWVLLESVELRHAPFFGYIKDLSAMDPYFILPLVMGASMFVQQRLNPTPPDPMQAKVMQWMPVMFTFFFLWFPSGLVLYWVVNNILSIIQQWIISRQVEASDSNI